MPLDSEELISEWQEQHFTEDEQRKAHGDSTMADDIHGIFPLFSDHRFPVYISFITNYLISICSDTFSWQNATVGYIEE